MASKFYGSGRIATCFLCLAWMLSGSATAANAGASTADGAIIGSVGKQHVTTADVMAQAKDTFEQQDASYQKQLNQLKVTHDRAHHELLQKELDQLLDRRALEIEASTSGKTTAAVLAEINVSAVTDDEARAFYDSHKERTSQTYDQLSTQIKQYLANQHNDAAIRSFYDGLRAKHGIVALLDPYRVAVGATGPSRGKANAPITIVEFADFQCPYCKQAEASLRAVMAKHPDDVRLVFRHLPLTDLHPNAIVAAQAGVCADRQGLFWPMHDAMFDDQSALAATSLKDTAKRVGLDTDKLTACMADGSTAQTIDADTKAADELGINGTPAFFVNGRRIDGSVPEEQFESVIADELHRSGGRRS